MCMYCTVFGESECGWDNQGCGLRDPDLFANFRDPHGCVGSPDGRGWMSFQFSDECVSGRPLSPNGL